MEIDEALVRRLVADQFPQWAHLPVRAVVPGGWDNRTFRLGDDLLARLPSARPYAAQTAAEQQWLPRLAPLLPLPIPELVAAGAPGEAFPWSWSVLRWLPGDTADTVPHDEPLLATDLARFLQALHRCDPQDGPLPGRRNGGRGGPLAIYDAEAQQAIAKLGPAIDGDRARDRWRAALAAAWQAPPVWVHGDLWSTNLLVRDGRLAAVIDWGLMAVGDPACDLAVAWRGFGPAGRAAFRAARPADPGSWARARGWALWKLAITAAGMSGRASEAPLALAALRDLLAGA